MAEKRKVSLQDLVNKKLNSKKQAEHEEGHFSNKPVQTQTMKSQLAKKMTQTRRKMGE